VGTVFFMLKDLSKEAVEKNNKKKLVALMNYILGNEPNIDTPRSYVDKLLEVSEKSHSFKFYDSVKENLIRFGFAVPDVIKKGYEKQRK
jgi:oligoribonuclease NrnB/cAMP/cGMP phosphodiesterase (DHH superfamily)